MQISPSGAPPPGSDADQIPEPPALRRLRWLVSALMVALILGILSVAAVLVIRLGGVSPAPFGVDPTPVSAAALSLPGDAEVLAIGRAGVEILVLLRWPDGAERLHAYDARTGALRSATMVERD